MAAQTNDYSGRILRVDLTSGQVSEEHLDAATLRAFVGGTGLGVKILYDEVPTGVGPFDPENRMIFASGPLGGTRAPGSGTYAVVTRGPLTNLLTATHANGFFGARLRFAGYDAIIVQGVSPTWVYLWIHDGVAELRDASHLVGKDTFETEDLLKEELGQTRLSVACIGPSGEHLVKYAAVVSDKGHVASTNGPGAVMGSKKLKAIAVYGKMEVPNKDEERTKGLAKEWFESAKQSALGSVVHAAGTVGYYSAAAETGWLPVKNMTTNLFPEHARFSAIRQVFELKPRPCYACPMAHCHVVKVTEGPYTGFEGEEPEYEDLAAWSSLVGITDPGAAVMLSDLNDRLGLDVKEGGFVVSLAMECYDKGLITNEDTGGLELVWGDPEAVKALLPKIARREGFGNVLAEGVMRAAQEIGGEAPEFAVYTKHGIAPHTHDPRGMWGIMFGQSVSDMGSIEGMVPDLLPDPDIGYPTPIPPFSPEGVPEGLSKGAPKRQFEDTLGVCMFLLGARLEIITDTVSAVTGWDFGPEEALEVGSRIVNLQRAFNLRHGLTPAQDCISPRLAQAPVDGPAKGKSIAPWYDQMVRDYYRHMGWDEETSKPLRETLEGLGLGYVAQDLWP
jgi:aldehyde:ferredoxin oxidoreductase